MSDAARLAAVTCRSGWPTAMQPSQFAERGQAKTWHTEKSLESVQNETGETLIVKDKVDILEGKRENCRQDRRASPAISSHIGLTVRIRRESIHLEDSG